MKTLVCAFLYNRKEIVLCPFCMTGKKGMKTFLYDRKEIYAHFRTAGKCCCVTDEKPF